MCGSLVGYGGKSASIGGQCHHQQAVSLQSLHGRGGVTRRTQTQRTPEQPTCPRSDLSWPRQSWLHRERKKRTLKPGWMQAGPTESENWIQEICRPEATAPAPSGCGAELVVQEKERETNSHCAHPKPDGAQPSEARSRSVEGAWGHSLLPGTSQPQGRHGHCLRTPAFQLPPCHPHRLTAVPHPVLVPVLQMPITVPGPPQTTAQAESPSQPS